MTFLKSVVASLLGVTCFAAEPHTFQVRDGHFALDGKPFLIVSGEMHYPRVPRAYWRARFKMGRAMGLNAVTTYVFWNVHEPEPGVYDFSGQNDIAEYLREAQQEGLYVILRPGPYVCAEWELGGFPAWLLKDHALVLRSTDPKFMEPTVRWLARLGKEVAPFEIGNGGPVIAVQVENEYGSFGSDRAYMEQIRRALVSAGFTKSLLYTADGPEQLPAGALPGMPAVINFGPGGAERGFAALRKFRPEGPFMNGEYWAGWFDNWGGKHAATNGAQQAAELGWMLRKGYSVSIYMFHGGTSFGWLNGANSNGKDYQPDVTSYDYDSALDESGRPAPKYSTFRDAIANATSTTPPAVPAVPAPIALPAFPLAEATSLWQNLSGPVRSADPLSMEDLGQAYGYILYRAQVHGPASGELVIEDLHDYAVIYVDGRPAGTLDRRLAQNRMRLEIKGGNARLDILVENTGRVNFTTVIRGERKGITKQVTYAGARLTGWDVYPLPMSEPARLPFQKAPCQGPCFYPARFGGANPADTFLDVGSLTKGQVWLNGRALGRVWSIGPQRTLYVPGPWLRKGANEIVVFDLGGGEGRTLRGLEKPVLNSVTR